MPLPSSFRPLTTLLVTGALSLQLAGCGQGPAPGEKEDEITTSGALVRAGVAAQVEAAVVAPTVTVKPTLVVNPDVVVTGTATTTTTVDTSGIRVDLDGLLTQDYQIAPSDVSPWQSEATLSYLACRDATERRCGNNKSNSTSRTVGWVSVESRKVVPNAKVRFGPFHLKKSVIVFGPGSGPSAKFTVSVWARSPAVYGAGGTFLGAQRDLVKIAEETRVITEQNKEEDLYITAKLPSVFTALQLQATVDDNDSLSPGFGKYPAACGNLPASTRNPEALDAPCLQAAINPMAVVSPQWVPLSILYEPPGNCSWANLTQEHTAGASISVVQTNSTSSNTVSDAGFFWDDEHTDYTSEKVSATSRRTQVTVRRSGSVGTRLGLPLSNPGNPNCNVPSADVPARLDGGPGRGDLFVLLKNPSLLYWDTANMTNTAFSPWSVPDAAESMVLVTAHQIATGEGLPPGVSFTDEERVALLALDPFVASPGGVPPASRFIPLDINIELGRGLPFEHTQSQAYVTEGGQTLTERTQSKSSTTSSDPVVDLTMKGLAYGSSAAASAGAAKALAALNGGFADMAGKMGSFSLPELYKDKSTTTVVTSYGKSTLLQQTNGQAVTQQFFIQDTGQGMKVSLYYDSLFGTYAFGPEPSSPATGNVITIRR
jgi:hypothetical protein